MPGAACERLVGSCCPTQAHRGNSGTGSSLAQLHWRASSTQRPGQELLGPVMCPESFFQISVTGIPGPAVGQEEIQVYLILFPSIGLDDRTEFYGSFSPFMLGEKPGPREGLVLSVLGSRRPIFWDQGPFCGWCGIHTACCPF